MWSTDGLPANSKVELSLRDSVTEILLSAQSFHVDKPIPSAENSRTPYMHDTYSTVDPFYFLENSKVFQWENLPTKRVHYTDIELDLNRMTEELTPAMSVGKTTVRN